MITLALMLALASQTSGTLSTGSASAELSRTVIPKRECGIAVGTSNSPVAFYREDGTLFRPSLGAQVEITNNSTTAVTYAFSQDATPVGITRRCNFSADDRGSYSAGTGPCVNRGPGTSIVYLTKGAITPPAPGSKPYACTTAGYSCTVTADCVAGTCTTRPSDSVHLFAVHGVSGGESIACSVQ